MEQKAGFVIQEKLTRGGKPVKSSSRLSSVANSIRLLKAFTDDEYELGVSSLAKRLGLAKSTVHRLASTLIKDDMLEQDRETGKYRLGLALFELGARVRRKMNVFNEAQFALKELVDKTGETAHLTVLDHASVLFLYKFESRQAIRMKSVLGARVPDPGHHAPRAPPCREGREPACQGHCEIPRKITRVENRQNPPSPPGLIF